MDASNRLNANARTDVDGRLAFVADVHRAIPHANSGGYVVELERWAAGEQKGPEAKVIIQAWLDKADFEAVLNLSKLGLKTIPPLPQGLRKLMLSNNQLSFIPENHLPATLKAIDVHNNQLTRLPESLPIANLVLLNAANNQIEALPACETALAAECKIYLRGNPLDQSMLEERFGPELNANGLRQLSGMQQTATYKQQPTQQDLTAQMLTRCLPIDMLPPEFSVEQLIASLPNVQAFTVFLTHITRTVCYQDPAFRTLLAGLIMQISADPVLAAKACSLAGELDPNLKISGLERYQLGFVFHKLRLGATDREIENGRFNGRPADIVHHLRQKYRAERIAERATRELWPDLRSRQDLKNQVAGTVAAKLHSPLALGFDMHALNDANESAQPDLPKTVIIANHVQNDEVSHFASYLAGHDMPPGRLLAHADHQIALFLRKTVDAHGNELTGPALTQLHLQDIKDYFASLGQPDPTLPVWKWNDDPNSFTGDFRPFGSSRSVKMTSAPIDQCKTQ